MNADKNMPPQASDPNHQSEIRNQKYKGYRLWCCDKQHKKSSSQ
jgi:hypothetical protein